MRLALFGSVLTDGFSDSSAIDILVEFRPGERVGFVRLADIQSEPGRLLRGEASAGGRLGRLSHHFRPLHRGLGPESARHRHTRHHPRLLGLRLLLRRRAAEAGRSETG